MIGDGIASTRLSDVNPRPVDWLWPGRLPIGKTVCLDGDPGDGKSSLVTDIAARITTGSPMPDGHQLTEPRNVVFLSAEDGAEDTIRPRFDAAGGDPERAVLLEGQWLDPEDSTEDPYLRPLTLPGDIGILRETIVRERAALVVVDVLNAWLSSKVDGHRDQDVRGALKPIAKLAEDTGSCIVLIRHLNKSPGSNPLYRGGGSIGIIGAVRVGMLTGADPDDETRRVLAVSKCNVATIAPALAYRLVDAPEHACARVQWEGAVDHSAADLLAVATVAGEDEADASTVLASILEDGPVRVKLAVDKMAEAGFSKDQAKRAKTKLKARSEKFGAPGDPDSGWQWALPREREGCEGGTVVELHPSHPSGVESLPSEDPT